jgi:hypothetical protein
MERSYEVGDVLKEDFDDDCWEVKGVNTVSGDLYLEKCAGTRVHIVMTVPAARIGQWRRVRDEKD